MGTKGAAAAARFGPVTLGPDGTAYAGVLGGLSAFAP